MMLMFDSFSLPEALDPAYASGFGGLSIHEFATDPNTPRPQLVLLGRAVRVFRYGDSGLQRVGAFSDEGGNDFRGIEQFTAVARNGKRIRYFAGSDRDHCLYIFRHTGQ